MITGASSGLGLATARQFAKLGLNVTLLCRDPVKGENAVTQVRQDIPNASLELMICDLASTESVRSFVRKFRESHSQLDILFNNATVIKQRHSVTQDGFETMFQTNYLAPFMITTSLLDLLRNSSSARIINIAVCLPTNFVLTLKISNPPITIVPSLHSSERSSAFSYSPLRFQ